MANNKLQMPTGYEVLNENEKSCIEGGGVISQIFYAFGRMFSGVYWNHEDSEVKKLEESHGAVVSKGNGVYTFSDGTTYETSTKDSYGFTSLGNFFNGFGDLFGIFSRYM
mgnify:FL=1